jgi:hypothetical protein
MAAAGAQSAIVQGAGQAYELSAHTAAGQVGDVIPGGAAGMLVPVAIATAVAEQIRAGQALARASQTKAQLVTAVSAGAVSATRVERAATYWVVDAATRAFVDVQAASEQAVARVWHAERDACVACLAYAGHYVSSPAGRFPAGLTYGDRPITPLGDIMGPPLHPGCRCSLSLVHVDVVNDLSDALKREAQRSVLRGWSLPSESEAVRLRAAEALLKQGNSLPKSVARLCCPSGELGQLWAGEGSAGLNDFPLAAGHGGELRSVCEHHVVALAVVPRSALDGARTAGRVHHVAGLEPGCRLLRHAHSLRPRGAPGHRPKGTMSGQSVGGCTIVPSWTWPGIGPSSGFGAAGHSLLRPSRPSSPTVQSVLPAARWIRRPQYKHRARSGRTSPGCR